MVNRSPMQTQPEHLTGTRAQQGQNKCIEHKRAPRGRNGLWRMAGGLWIPNAAHCITSGRNIAPGGDDDRRINEILRWRRVPPGNADCSGSAHRISIFILEREWKCGYQRISVFWSDGGCLGGLEGNHLYKLTQFWAWLRGERWVFSKINQPIRLRNQRI